MRTGQAKRLRNFNLYIFSFTFFLRQNENAGVRQANLDVIRGNTYQITGYIKLLNDNSKIWQSVKVVLQYQLGEAPG